MYECNRPDMCLCVCMCVGGGVCSSSKRKAAVEPILSSFPETPYL